MPTIELDKKMIFKLIGRKINDSVLKEKISMLGTKLEKIDDNKMSVEISPNRPDLLSEQGFARALSSFMGIKIGLRKYFVEKSNNLVIIEKSVNEVRPYTVCAIVKKLKFDDEKIKEIIQIQEKLHVTYGRNRKKAAIGIYPCEKIKFPIRYLAKKPEEIEFIPLEFTKKLSANQILVLHPAGREYGDLLKGKKVYPLFIDSKNQILSMPPIINSNTVGKITNETTDVFIECSGFNFEYLSKCLNIIVTALADMGGKVCSLTLKYPDKTRATPNLELRKMKIDIDYINKRLGLNLKENDMKKLLEKMGFDYKNKIVFVPAYRTDVMQQIDFAEDIAIAYGFENFEEIIPKVATIGEESAFEVFKNKIRDVLVGHGLIEVKNFHLINKKSQNQLMNTKLELVEIENSFSEEYEVLRAWIVPSLLKNLKDNKHHEYPQNIFEIGTVFIKDQKEETGVKENERLCIALCGSEADFTRIKQITDSLFKAINILYTISETEHQSFIEGRVGRISLNNKNIAYLGEIHPQVLKNFELEMPVSVLEINLTELFALLTS